MGERATQDRLPRGQVLTRKWPVLTYGETPRLDLANWTFRCYGLVQEPVTWTWKEFLELPRVEVTSDVHCVTRWSRFDNRWEGVAVSEILRRARVLPEASAVMVHADPDYTTNLLLTDLVSEDALLAYRHDGASRCRWSTVVPAGWWYPGCTSGKAPNGCVGLSFSITTRPGSGSRTAIT